MRPVLALLRKDLINFLNEPVAVLLTFAVPLALIYIFGSVFGSGEALRTAAIPLAVVNASDSRHAARLVAALKSEPNFRVVTHRTDDAGATYPISEYDARQMLMENQLRFALVLPEEALAEDRPGLRVRLLQNPRNEIETAMVSGLVERHVMAQAPMILMETARARANTKLGGKRADEFYGRMADIVAEYWGADRETILQHMRGEPSEPQETSDSSGFEDTPPDDAKIASLLNDAVEIEKEQLVGAQVANPGPTRNVGGWAMMFLLFSLSSSSSSLFEEKRAGLFLRLLAAPVRRTHILWSKYLAGTLIGLGQLLVLFVAGNIMYGIEVFAHFPALVVVAVSAAAACTAFGMLLAAVAPSRTAAGGMATLLILTMSAVGGAWFPITLMPDALQVLAKLTIVYWAMEGFLGVLWQGQGVIEILPVVGVLLGMAAAVNLVSAWRFARGHMFQ